MNYCYLYFKNLFYMKSLSFILFLLLLNSCKTVTINNSSFKTAKENVEIGSIGHSKSGFFENTFSTTAFPFLNNKIRVSAEIVPFNKKLNKLYSKKIKFNQNQNSIHYVDSLDIKPELCILKILDINGFVNEINSTENKSLSDFLKETQKSKIITSIAVRFSQDELAKIKQADTYYIANSQEKKYILHLYKGGKKTEVIDLQYNSVILGYKLSKCCWSLNTKNQWYLTDLINEYSNCKGASSATIKKEKEIKNLLKL